MTDEARDDIATVQLLSPSGERTVHPDYDLDISAQECASLYRDLVLVRRFDTEATALQRQGELSLWASLLGQEAAQVGAGRAMRARDYVFSSYREHGVAYCKGIDPVQILGFWRSTMHSGWDPNETAMAPATVIIGAQTLHAVGYAMGVQRDGGDDVAVAFFGDGASSQGDVNEAFAWASVFQAPVVFFCQNNQWAISEPTERQTRIPLYQRALGFGFPGVRVDGNDVLAVLAVTRVALERARSGGGPTLIEAFTYRMGPHTTSDDPTLYRPSEELEFWQRRDPIERLKAYLVRENAVDEAFFDQVEQEADQVAAHTRAGCLGMPNPLPLSMFDNVYAEESSLLTEERSQLASYLATFDEVS
jgi:2-oxoisovalerate dehydrogenase E1 component alpha subunit